MFYRWTGQGAEKDFHKMGEQAPDKGKSSYYFTDY